MHRILVAGGAGFIGSHLCKSLVAEGKEVICVDNFITGDKSNITQLIDDSRFTLIEHDVSQPFDTILSKLNNLTHIFHLASPASPNKKSPKSYISFPIETLLVNSIGTYNLLNIAKEKNAKFLYASSSEVYGNPAVSPQPESYFGNVNPNGVRSVYDEGKRFGEAITMAYLRKHNVDTRIVRIFNTFGPFMQKDDGRVVSNFITQALSNQPLTVYGQGKQTRSFCFVSDMIDGLKRAIFVENTKGGVFNLGNPDERTIAELATMIKEMTHTSSQIVFEEMPEDDPKMRKPDILKAKQTLQWEPKVSLQEGIQKTIEYFSNN